VAEGEQSLDQLMQLAVSVYYNWDITKREKSIRDIRPNCRSQGVLHLMGLHPKLATIVDRSGTSGENAQNGDSPGDSPSPHQDLAPSAKVTTRVLSVPISRWNVGCHLL
jgi:hypothetical protein